MQFYYSNCEQNASNLLVINVQPNEGFSLCVNGKISNQNNEMQKVKLSYTMPIKDKMNTVDAYENLIYDILIGEQTKFTHWEELKILGNLLMILKMYGNKTSHSFLIMPLDDMGLKKVKNYLVKTDWIGGIICNIKDLKLSCFEWVVNP